jgi:hypothetical protein
MAPTSSTPDTDPAAARTARRRAVLERLTEMGMKMAEALDAELEAFQAEPRTEDSRKTLTELIDANHQISRSVRLTVALEEKLDLDREVRLRRAETEAARAAQAEAAARFDQGRDLLRHAVEEVIDAEVGLTTNRGSDLRRRLERRVEREGADRESFLGRPVGALITRVCLDLGLDPDWEDWPDEPWAATAKACDDRPPREAPKPRNLRARETAYRALSSP